MSILPRISPRLMVAGLALGALTACENGLDMDLRGDVGGSLDTSQAAQNATAPRPRPDRRGVISYPNYQVAVARRGDTLQDVSARIGIPAAELARYNAIDANTTLRQGEIIALPYRVAEPSPATGGRGVVMPPSDVDIASVAGSAIDNAQTGISTEPLQPAPSNAPRGETGFEPVRHKVQRGETAYTIARLHKVSVRSLAEWNGLDSSYTIREKQILLIPPVRTDGTGAAAAGAAAGAATTVPGQGSPTPTPPSASTPLPPDDTATAVSKPPEPDLGASQSNSAARMGYPVNGKIIRPYAKGKNNGIDISADPGSPVRAAANGQVAAITKDADNIEIVVVRHPDNLMTVYYNVAGVTVSKGQSVKRGQSLAAVPRKNNYVHFEVRKGFDSIDPMPYLR